MTSRRASSTVHLVALLLPVASAALAGCADDHPTRLPTLVAVAAQRCMQPNWFRGVGVVVGDGLVATAGHTVEGPLRALEVGGAPARVAVLDRRTDVALLEVELEGEPYEAELATSTPASGRVVTRQSATGAIVRDVGTLVVEHATDGATYRRDVVSFTPVVPPGTSGAALLDASGRLVGLVVATDAVSSYAVSFSELRTLLDARRAGRTEPAPPAGCGS